MAIQLVANYSKKIGLPEFSSHSFSVSIESEVTDVSQVGQECSRLYKVLQDSVDLEIQHQGFVPEPVIQNGNGNGQAHQINGNHPTFDRWNCTDGQRGFILRIVSDHKLEKQAVEDLSQRLFGMGVKQVNKMQASQLIEELLIQVGKPARQNRWRQTTTTQ